MPRRESAQRGDPFQEWLRSELEARDWSYSKLARELDVFKGTVELQVQHPVWVRAIA